MDNVAIFLENFLDPRKRTCLLYLASALVISLVWLIFLQRRSIREALDSCFSRQIWWSVTAKQDYALLFLNKVFSVFVANAWLSSTVATFAVFEWLHSVIPVRPSVELNPSVVMALFTLCLFIFDDLTKYIVHWMLHNVPCLWAFHKVHHSALSLTPLTIFRTHPIEIFVFSMRSIAVRAGLIATFIFFFGEGVDLITVLGVNVGLFIFHLLGSNLRHSHIYISYWGWLEKWLISPAQHQLHHSVDPNHHGKNLGITLAIWDRLCGTLLVAPKNLSLKFGFEVEEQKRVGTLRYVYFDSFIESLCSLINFIIRGPFIMFKKRKQNLVFGFLLFSLLIGLGVPSLVSADPGSINIYSHRQPFLIKPFLKAFTEKTGVKTNILYSKRGLAARIQAEGKNTPADVVLTVDIARMMSYHRKGVLASIKSKVLDTNVPEHLRSSDNTWFALSKRARIVAISKDRVTRDEIKRIEDLQDLKWRGRICSRPGSHVYNRSLLASIIAANGAEKASRWARGLVENLARRPQGNDRAQIKAIHSGECDLALVNHYYYGKLLFSNVPDQRTWAKSVNLIFTNQSDRGNHVNISGGGVVKYSKNKENAISLLEFLTQKTAQRLYGEINFEYPVNPAVPIGKELLSWGNFKEDKIEIEKIASLARAAQKIIDKTGW